MTCDACGWVMSPHFQVLCECEEDVGATSPIIDRYPFIILGSSTGATSPTIELVFERDSILYSLFSGLFLNVFCLVQVVYDGFERC